MSGTESAVLIVTFMMALYAAIRVELYIRRAERELQGALARLEDSYKRDYLTTHKWIGFVQQAGTITNLSSQSTQKQLTELEEFVLAEVVPE